MDTVIYFIIALLFAIYIIWTWNSTREFKSWYTKILYLIVGTIFVGILTAILFAFSKIGVQYPKPEMVGEVRKIILLIFIPINGFLILPQIASLMSGLMNKDISTEDIHRRWVIIGIIVLGIIIFECMYFKNMQNGMINLINMKKG